VKVENKKKIHRDESVTLTVTLTKEQMALLKEASDLISHSVPDKNWADVIAYLAQKEIDRRTKVTRKSPTKPMGASAQSKESSVQAKKASKSQAKGSDIEQSDLQCSDSHNSGSQGDAAALVTRVEQNLDVQVIGVKSHSKKAESSSPHRAPISPNLRKEVLNRDKCCQFKDPKTGKICGDTRFPQVDHIQSIWAGGTNDPLNLQQLCAKHNQYKYRKEAGYSH